MSTDAYVHIRTAGIAGGTLAFAFHGTGADEHQLVGLAGELMPGATIVSPRGDVSEYGAARFFRRTGEGVYDMADLERATRKMAGFVAAHRDTERPARTVGLGYSNGANILASTIFAQPGLFDAAALMHPLIPFEPTYAGRLEHLRILITAGRRDPICPPDLTERLALSLAQAGAKVETAWHDGGHEVRPAEIDAARKFLAANPANEEQRA